MVKIRYYGNEGLGLAWDFKGIFCVFFMRTKFMIRDAKKNFFFVLNMDLEGNKILSLYTYFRGLYKAIKMS